MKYKNLLASFTAALMLVSGLNGQNLKPGTVTFKNIHGSVAAHNINTGVTEEITTESLLTEGFAIETQADGYLDVVFSNGVVGRLAPNSKVLIESFDVTGSNRSAATGSNLHLMIECGDIVVNATEKEEGELLVKTPSTIVNSDLTKFFVSHGGSNAVQQDVTRAINLGALPIQVTSRMNTAFTNNNSQVSYGYFDQYAEEQSVSLDAEATAVVISANETAASYNQPVAGSELQKPVQLQTDQWNQTSNTNMAAQEGCDATRYSLLPYDRCLIDQLSLIGDYALYGGGDPTGSVLVTAAAQGSTYFNINSTEVGDLEPGMMLPDGTIIRTMGGGNVTAVFPNGAIAEVQPNSNVYIESISSQPVLSDPLVDKQTNITLRVENGEVIANTLGTPQLDTFAVISPLDRHSVASNTVVAVKFLQMDSTVFQSVSSNQTPQGSSGINSVVVSNGDLSFVSDYSTFIEYAQNGNDFQFTTPPSYSHITESAIIPPDYEFIDRTIAFAASVIPSPQNITTQDPGNFQRFTDGEDPVTP